MKNLFHLAAIIILSTGVLFASGFNFGMTGAVKSKVKELDEQVRTYRLTHPSADSLILRGNFSTASTAAKKATGDAIDRVVLVNPNSFKVENIGSGNFSIGIGESIGKPLGIIFINTSGEIAGCLSTVVNSTDTLSLLPLTKIKDGTRDIDLQTIYFSTDTYGNIAVPTYNPVSASGEIPFTETERSAAAKGSKILSNILKNPDIDGNGTVDFLQGKYYNFNFMYELSVGALPVVSGNGSYDAAVSSVTKLDHFLTILRIFDSSIDNSQASIKSNYPLTFPASYTWAHASVVGITGGNSMTSNTGSASGGTVIPTDGEYVVNASADGYGSLTFNISGQTDSLDSVIIPFPTIQIMDGNIRKITWLWKLKNDITGPSIDPSAFIEDLVILISKDNNSTRTYNSYGTMHPEDASSNSTHPWSGVVMTGAENEHVIGASNLSWENDCTAILMGYIDKFGNRVNVYFRK